MIPEFTEWDDVGDILEFEGYFIFGTIKIRTTDYLHKDFSENHTLRVYWSGNLTWFDVEDEE